MPLDGDYEPSPHQWVRDQVATYERSGGADGNTIMGRPIVVLTSRGQRSGRLRKNPVMRVEHDGRYAAVASKGGAPDQPEWYYNFLASPRVDVQDGAVVQEYVARLVDGDERREWWERAVAAFPRYAEYQEKTDRQIPVFVLDPA